MATAEPASVVVWEWKKELLGPDDDDASWAPYEEAVCESIEKAFGLARSMHEVTIGTRQFNIHFGRSMVQDDPQLKKRRPVRRRVCQGGLRSPTLPETGHVGPCTFCMEMVYPGSQSMPPSPLPCGHYFHGACLTPWALGGKQRFCPNCRGKVPRWSEVPNIGAMDHSRHSWRGRSARGVQIQSAPAATSACGAGGAGGAGSLSPSSSTPFHVSDAKRAVSGLDDDGSMMHRHSNDFDEIHSWDFHSPPTSTAALTAPPAKTTSPLPSGATPSSPSQAAWTGTQRSPTSTERIHAKGAGKSQGPLGFDLETSVHYGAQKNNVELVRHGLDKGVSLDCRAANNLATPLIEAAHYGAKDVVELLLSRRANVHHATREDRTALFVAGAREHAQIVKLLLDNKANPERAAEFQGRMCRARDLPCVARELRARGDFGGSGGFGGGLQGAGSAHAASSSMQGLAVQQKP